MVKYTGFSGPWSISSETRRMLYLYWIGQVNLMLTDLLSYDNFFWRRKTQLAAFWKQSGGWKFAFPEKFAFSESLKFSRQITIFRFSSATLFLEGSMLNFSYPKKLSNDGRSDWLNQSNKILACNLWIWPTIVKTKNLWLKTRSIPISVVNSWCFKPTICRKLITFFR